MKHIQLFEDFNEEMNKIINNLPDDADYRHLSQEFNIGDYVVGNIHISKDLSGKNLEQVLFINKRVGKIIELFGTKAYKVNFLEQIPADEFYSVFGKGNKTPITIIGEKTSSNTILNKRQVRKPTKDEMKKYLIQKDANKYNL